MRAADLDHAAIHQDHRGAQQVVGGDPIFQTMRPARVHGDVAADGTGQLAGGIRGVEKPVRLHRARDRQVGAPGLDPYETVCQADLQHRIHPRKAQDHAIRRGQRTPGKAGACAARHDRHALLVADAQHGRDLGGRARQHRRQRRAAIGGQRVALIGPRLGRIRNQRIRRQNVGQPRKDPVTPSEDRGRGAGHVHGRHPANGIIGKKV